MNGTTCTRIHSCRAKLTLLACTLLVDRIVRPRSIASLLSSLDGSEQLSIDRFY